MEVKGLDRRLGLRKNGVPHVRRVRPRTMLGPRRFPRLLQRRLCRSDVRDKVLQIFSPHCCALGDRAQPRRDPAVFASLDLTLNGGIKVDNLITFGQPRGGDSAFASFVMSNLEEYRLVHFQDPVPHLPPKDLLGSPFFMHPTTEVFYEQRDSTGTYKVCEGQEDETCSDQFLVDIDLLNHLHYVGFDFITNYLGCKL